MYSIYCKLRDEKGVKDADVSKATGITKSTFSDWKSGRSKPKNDKLEKIANYFNVPIEYLLGKEDTTKIINWNELGDRLRQIREVLKLSADEFASYVLDEDEIANYNYWEAGVIDDEERFDEFIDVIVDEFKINRYWLYYGHGQKFNYSELLKHIDNLEGCVGQSRYFSINSGFVSPILQYLPIEERVRLIRKKNKLSIKEFSKRLNVSSTIISNIEHGKQKLTTQMLKLICHEFNIKELWLRTGEGDMLISNGLYDDFITPTEVLLNIASVVKSGLENFSNDDLDALKSSASFLLSAVNQELSKRENKQNNET